MISLVRPIIAWLLVNGLYVGLIVAGGASAFVRADIGLFALVALIPLPNLFYKLYEFPLGKDLLDIIFVCVFIGIFINKKGFRKSQSSIIIMLFVIMSYISVWNATFNFSLPPPFSAANPALKAWKAYCFMIVLYFLVVNAITNEKQQQMLLITMVTIVLLLSIKSNRDFIAGASFVDERRDPGPFWIVGLGSNHFGAFVSYCLAFVLGIFLFDKDKKRRWLYLATLLLGLHPLFFSYSRGAYVAAFCVVAFYGIVSHRRLLIAVVLVVVLWEAVLPVTVVERIRMTETGSGELEESAGARLMLWNNAMAMFRQYPILGSGFNGFTFAHQGEHWSDTHNFYLKTLSEQGVIGTFLLIVVLLSALRSGWILHRKGVSPFQKGLGYGFLGCVISHIVCNMFGDRWSYYEMGSYFWVFWGLVDRGILISRNPIESG